MIDTHAHLGEDAEAVIDRARGVGVTRIVEVATTLEGARATLARAEAHDGVYACLGIHPHEAAGEHDLSELRRLLSHPRAVAVGETGLDYFRDYAPHDAQQRLFDAQLAIAAESGKPVVIHTRAADDDTIATLRSRAAGVRVILHCFSMPDRLDECLAEGWYISFAGNVTYPKNVDLAAAAERVPDDRILVETDAPYLTPQALRKHRNQPAYVTETAQFVAERRGQGYAELEAIVERNAAELFAW